MHNVSLLVAIGVSDEGFREVLAVVEGSKEDKASWTAFLRHLNERGLKGMRLFVLDKCLGLAESLGESYPEALWQRCAVHFYRNVWTAVPTSKMKEVAAMLKAIHARERPCGGAPEGRTSHNETEGDEVGRRCRACTNGD